MAKIDDVLESVGNGFTNSAISFGFMMVPDAQMESYSLRRKQGGQAEHKACWLSVGEMGQPATITFFGHKLSDCVKKALEWRGLPTKSKRGPRKASAT